MTNIKIHGQKIQFHKSLSISVTTSCGTGGNIDVQFNSGYSLSDLPPGTTFSRRYAYSYVFDFNYGGQTIGYIDVNPENETGYDFDACGITSGGGTTPVSTTPIELNSGDVIGFTFVQVNTILWFYSDVMGQWYDSDNLRVDSAKLPVGLYTISSFTQSSSKSYALTISGNSTYTYYYIWTYPITINYLNINGSQESIPYPIVSGDYLRVNYTEIPGVTLASETQFGKWVNYNTGEEITFIPAKANANSIYFDVASYGYDSKSIILRPRDGADITDEIVYKCVDDGFASEVEITNVYEDYGGNKFYYGSPAFSIPVGYGIYGRMDMIGATLKQPGVSSSNLLQDILAHVPCLSAQQQWDIQPQPTYLFEDIMTGYLCGFFTTNNLQNTVFAIVIFDRGGNHSVINSCCYSYSGNVYGINDYAFMNTVKNAEQIGATIDYNNLQIHNMPLYSNTQLIDEVMHEFHIR